MKDLVEEIKEPALCVGAASWLLTPLERTGEMNLLMKKIFVSWVAWYYDFDSAGGLVKQDGPTCNLHKSAWKQFQPHLHLLLDPSNGQDPRAEFLHNHLLRKFPRQETHLLPVYLPDIMDFQGIKQAVARSLEPFAGDELYFVISTGTTPMRTVWILLHLEDNGLKTHLLQGIDTNMDEGGKPHYRRLELDGGIFQGKIRARYVSEEPRYLITDSLQGVYSDARLASGAEEIPILIEGPSGSGKEALAQYIHRASPRGKEEFMTVNCAALADDLLESRLFGHEKGSFTGASSKARGLFQVANKGTLFLDEIGEISPRLQQSLLRVLQEQEVLPVGADKPVKVDVRIIAATNRNLYRRCEEGHFRWDLYYRLSTVELRLPAFDELPPEERKQYFMHFLEQHRGIGRRTKALRLDPVVVHNLLAQPFPGNIREVENLIKSLYVFTAGSKVTVADLEKVQQRREERWDLSLAAAERKHILRVLAAFEGNLTQAAKALGIAVNTLKRKLEANDQV